MIFPTIFPKSYLKKEKIIFLLLSCFLFFDIQNLCAFDYQVTFSGIRDVEILDSFKSASQTYALQSTKTNTMQILRRRVESDIPKLIDVAHYYGYYSCHIQYTIERSSKPQVLLSCNLGPLFTIKNFTILPTRLDTGKVHNDQKKDMLEPPFNTFDENILEIKIDDPAKTLPIISAERTLIHHLRKEGYAFCKMSRREALIDLETHSLALTFFVETGPQVHFGSTSIFGLKKVKPEFVEKYIECKKGTTYSPDQIEKTQTLLEKSGLFSSIVIDEKQQEGNEMPLHLHLEESKHRSLGAGFSYTTSKGPGIAGEWEDRNIRGLGERLTFRTELWKKFQNATITFKQPHLNWANQELLWILEYDKEHTIAFASKAYSVSSLFEKQVNIHTQGLWGLRIERLHSQSFEGDLLFYLIKAPLQLKWSRANNLLDPTKGETLNVKVTPTHQLFGKSFVYLTHLSTVAGYTSFFKDRITLASKGVLGNIFGASKHTIPSPDRFYAGSDNTLRGYKYQTVSPLRKKKIPIGGRSLLALSLETRIRMESGLGWVVFFDIGNVYGTNFPLPKDKFLKSVGLGARYTTPIGPIRIDFAVPLNRRRQIDPPFQIYFSIGQAF